MNISEISAFRLINQHISGNKLNTVNALFSDMGAIQAQDYAMAKWAIGLRMKKATEQLINKAIDDGDIIRTHLLRPTWHFVLAKQLNWIRELTAPGIKSSMKSRNRELELTEEVFRKSHKILKGALKGGNSLTRDELILLLNKANIRTENNRASHLFMEAELDGVICSGRTKGNKITYALIEDRIHHHETVNKEVAVAKLANIYFSSRGPAELEDFAWWSGLTLTKIKSAAVESINSLRKFRHKEYLTDSERSKNSVHLLPPFDEYIISYKDRSAIIFSVNHKKIISSNGVFRALIIENGIVIGIWKRTLKKDKVLIEAECFKSINRDIKNSIESEVIKYGNFLGKEAVLSDIHNVNK